VLKSYRLHFEQVQPFFAEKEAEKK